MLRTSSSSQRFFSLLVVLGVGACSGTHATGVPELPQCTGSVESITVSAGTTPTISWQPECRMAALAVYRADGSESMWFFNTDWRSAPGLRYGTVPSGAEVVVAAKPLTSGVAYVVDIMPPAGGSGPVPVFGRRPFTP